MKFKIYVNFLFLVLLSLSANAQIKTIITNGKHIIGPCGDTLILRGVNYAPYNWGWSPNENFTSEIAKTGANCIRLQWYKNAGNATPNTLYNNQVFLDSTLAKCVRYKLIPILTLQDETCKNDILGLQKLTEWYKQPQILAVLNKYKHTLIINIANEALYINWASNKALARTNFKATYTAIIDSLRKAGLTMPLMIDGSECGTNLKELSDVAASIIDTDPLQNVIFSAHTYWYAYANNDSATMTTELNYALGKDFPLVIGELANEQDNNVNCEYTLNYKPLLNFCQLKKINWIAYGWYRDVCPNREISSTGLITNLTTYGNNIVNNSYYGIKNTAIIAKHFNDPNCMKVNNISTFLNQNNISISPNPVENQLCLYNLTDKSYNCKIFNLDGKLFFYGKVNKTNNKIDVSLFSKGIYFIQIESEQLTPNIKFIKY